MYIYIYIHIYICIFVHVCVQVAWAQARMPGVNVPPCGDVEYTRRVSNSAPTWSSRCCFTACHFLLGKSLGRNELSPIRDEPNWK